MEDYYGKLYAKTFTGSMLGAGPVVFAVWGYAIANASPPEGWIELNPKLLAAMIGTTATEVEAAIQYLSSPDPQSRSSAEEGRRMVRVGSFAYRLVNFVDYRVGRDPLLRKEYQRKWIERKRAKAKQAVDTAVDQGRPMLTQAETETETETETELVNTNTKVAVAPKSASKRFSIPALEEIRAYCKEINFLSLDTQEFIDYYEGCGWTIGKSKKPMKDWKATVRTWKRTREKNVQQLTLTPPKPKTQADFNAYMEKAVREARGF